MTSLKQIEANRRNALKSTGPATEEGKKKSRNNALKHGVTCGIHVPLRHEDQEDLAEIRERLYSAWNPATDKESMQLEIIITQYMNLRRAERFETNYIDQGLSAKQRQHGVPEIVSWNDDFGIALLMASREHERAFRLIERYTRRAHKLYTEAVRLLETMQKERRRQEEKVREASQRNSTQRSREAAVTVGGHQRASQMGSFCKETVRPVPVDITQRL